jgi:hypothetical protein
MIPIQTAIAHYVDRANTSTPSTYPMVWSAHYSTAKLGEFGFPWVEPGREGDLIFGAMVPFALSPAIQSSYLAIDPLHAPRRLRIVRLAIDGKGVRSTFWTAPLVMTDDETWVGEPRQQKQLDSSVDRALRLIADARLETGGRWSFADAYYASKVFFEEIL